MMGCGVLAELEFCLAGRITGSRDYGLSRQRVILNHDEDRESTDLSSFQGLSADAVVAICEKTEGMIKLHI